MLITAAEFPALFLEHRPLLDVRAEVEFNKGSFPAAVNFPILCDPEREKIGIIYKQNGSEAAVKAGYEMISGEVKETRLTQWQTFMQQHPDAALYCFRGGQRSTIAAQWLKESGFEIPKVDGGYKALRRFLIDGTVQWAEHPQLFVVGGKTGTGKTRVLQQFSAQLDLEGLAAHRGSAFGRRVTPQPNQIDFENALAIKLLKHKHKGFKQLLIEDESSLVGRLKVPSALFDRMSQADLFIIEKSLADRVQIIFEEYILEQLQDYQRISESDTQAFDDYAESLLGSLNRISRRLGGVRYKALNDIMETALKEQKDGKPELHKEWIAQLLSHYYDPMYEYQLEKKKHRIQFTGCHEEIITELSQRGFSTG